MPQAGISKRIYAGNKFLTFCRASGGTDIVICGVGGLCIASRSLEGEGSSGMMGGGGRRGCLFVGGVLGQLARLQSNWLGRYYRLSDSATDGNVTTEISCAWMMEAVGKRWAVRPFGQT